MKRIIICSILAITSIDGQVCCSLVGTVNTGTSTVVSAHYPSDMEFEKEMKWNVGLIGTMNFNNSELIKYPFANNGYFEISDYFTKTSIWFIHASFSAILLNETVSFDKASTYIIGGKGQIGIRNKLTYRMGFLEYSLNFPVKPYYTNNDFPFKTDVIPSYSFNWIKTKLLDSNFNLQMGIIKNFKEKEDVFIDNNFGLTFWIEEQMLDLLINPYFSLHYQKLIAPLTPFENNRDSRLMSFVYVGMNLIPLNPKFDFIQFNINIPIYRWVSEIGFPEGTIPSTSFSITFFSNGSFIKSNQSNIFN